MIVIHVMIFSVNGWEVYWTMRLKQNKRVCSFRYAQSSHATNLGCVKSDFLTFFLLTRTGRKDKYENKEVLDDTYI